MTIRLRSLLLVSAIAVAGPQIANAAKVTMGFDELDLAGQSSIQVGDFYSVAPNNLGITFGRLYDDPLDPGPGTVMDHSDVYAKAANDVWGNVGVGQQFLRSAKNCLDDNLADFDLCDGEDPVVEFIVADGFDSLSLDFFVARAGQVTVRVTNNKGETSDTQLACALGDWCLDNKITFAGVGSKVQFLGATLAYGIDNITMELHTNGGTVPEPASFGLAGLALLGLAGTRRRSAKR